MEAEVTQVKPLSNYILVEVLTKENKTTHGIIAGIEETVFIPYCKALKKGKLTTEDVEEGKTYMYNQHGGTKVMFKDKPYLFIKESDLYAEIEQ